MTTELIHPITGLRRTWEYPVRAARAVPVEAAPIEPAKHSAVAPALQRIIQPAAQYRWLGLPIASYTPDLIETIIRGALMGNIVYCWQMYDLMEATWPRLMKNLNEIKEEVASLPWAIQAWAPRGQKAAPEAQARAEALETAIWSMRPNPAQDECDFRGMIKETLEAWSKGLSIVEVLWEMGPDSIIAPRAAQWVHPQNYGYGPDGATLMLNVAGYDGSNSCWRDFPANQFLIGIAKQKSGHPTGGALLRALAWWWSASNFTSEWFLNCAQIFGMPIRWATYDPTRPELQGQIMTMLQQMGSAGYGAFPAGTELKLLDASGISSKENPQAALLDRADKMCDLLVLGQTLTSQEGSTGSRSLAAVHESVLKGRKKAAADWVGALLNAQFAPAFCRLNYGDDSQPPTFLVDIIEEQSALEMAQRDVLLINAGVEVPKGWAYERWGIPEPDEDDEVIGKPPTPALPAGMAGPDGLPPKPGVKVPNEQAPNEQAPNEQPPKPGQETQAKDATDQLAEHVLEDLGHVQAKWLASVKPVFKRLIDAARSNSVSDAQLMDAVEKARREFPELFHRLDTSSLAKAMEAAMGAAVVNGAVKGFMRRGGTKP